MPEDVRFYDYEGSWEAYKKLQWSKNEDGVQDYLKALGKDIDDLPYTLNRDLLMWEILALNLRDEIGKGDLMI